MVGFKKDKIRTPIDADLIKENKLIKEQSKKIQALEGQLSRVQANTREKKTEKQEEVYEQKLIEELLDKETEIKRNKYENHFPLKVLYRKLLSMKGKKFANKLELVDKDDKKVFDIFKDFCFLPNGNLAIIGKSGEVWAEGKSVNQIIYKPESFKNQIKRKRILLPYDENYKYVPDFENLLMPQISYDDSDDSYHESEEVMKTVKQMVMERDDEIRDKGEKIEHLEQTIAALRNTLRDSQRAKSVYQNSSEVSQTEVSKALEKSMQFEQKMGEMQMTIVKLQEQKNITEKLKEGLEQINYELLEKQQEMGSKTDLRRAMELTEHYSRVAKDLTPRQIIEHHTPEKQEIQTKPGESINKK